MAVLSLRCCARAFSSCSEQGLLFVAVHGLLIEYLLLLRSTGSRRVGFSSCGSPALEHRLSSCGAWAYLLRCMWDLPGPGIEPVTPALAGGFLTTAPPGKPRDVIFGCSCQDVCVRSSVGYCFPCAHPNKQSVGTVRMSWSS